jgi:hypothetical protein
MCSVGFFINLFFFQSLNLDTRDTRRAWNIKLLTLDSRYSFVQNTDSIHGLFDCRYQVPIASGTLFLSHAKEENWERGVTNLIFEEMRTVFKTYIRFDHILLPPL